MARRDCRPSERPAEPGIARHGRRRTRARPGLDSLKRRAVRDQAADRTKRLRASRRPRTSRTGRSRGPRALRIRTRISATRSRGTSPRRGVYTCRNRSGCRMRCGSRPSPQAPWLWSRRAVARKRGMSSASLANSSSSPAAAAQAAKPTASPRSSAVQQMVSDSVIACEASRGRADGGDDSTWSRRARTARVRLPAADSSSPSSVENWPRRYCCVISLRQCQAASLRKANAEPRSSSRSSPGSAHSPQESVLQAVSAIERSGGATLVCLCDGGAQSGLVVADELLELRVGRVARLWSRGLRRHFHRVFESGCIRSSCSDTSPSQSR